MMMTISKIFRQIDTHIRLHKQVYNNYTLHPPEAIGPDRPNSRPHGRHLHQVGYVKASSRLSSSLVLSLDSSALYDDPVSCSLALLSQVSCHPPHVPRL